MPSTRIIFISCALMTGLAGCYESTEVTVFEPGVYKGLQDPLLQTDAQARAESLKQRFTLVQTDR